MSKNIRKTLIIFSAVAVALLLVSSVTAVPNTQSMPFNEQKEKIVELTCKLEQFAESPGMKRIASIAEKNIDEDKHAELEEKVRSIVDSLFYGSIDDLPDWVEELLALISAICCSIVEIFLLVLGHNSLGLGLGIIVMSVVMIIPIFMFIVACYFADILNSPFYVLELIDEVLDIEEILHDGGIIGLFMVLVLFIVIWICYAAFIAIVGIPLITLVMLDKIIQDILDLYAYT